MPSMTRSTTLPKTPDTLGRRSLLRGLGAGTVLLSGMTRTLLAEAAAPNLRAAFIFHANGSQWQWAPKGPGGPWTAPGSPGFDSYVGPNYVLSPHLGLLEPVRANVTIIKNLVLAREPGHPHR